MFSLKHLTFYWICWYLYLWSHTDRFKFYWSRIFFFFQFFPSCSLFRRFFFCIPGLLKESIDLIFSPQKEKTSQRKKSVTFQLPSEDKHVLALDFLSWIMVRMNPNRLLISLNNTKARSEALILMDPLYCWKIHLCFEIAIEKHTLTAWLPRFIWQQGA